MIMQEGLLGKPVWAGGNQWQECQRDWGDRIPAGVSWEEASLFINNENMQAGKKKIQLFNIASYLSSCPQRQLFVNKLQLFLCPETGQKSGSWASAIPFVVIWSW